jgi:hypothetical protein
LGNRAVAGLSGTGGAPDARQYQSRGFEIVEEIDTSPCSVDLADFNACGMGPGDLGAALVATIEANARKSRAPFGSSEGRRIPQSGGDYPLDPEQD